MARILIVEDDAHLANSIRRALVGFGECVVASSIGAAERLLAAEDTLDAAIVDRRLPDGDGLVIAEWLAARGVPSLILTGEHPDEKTVRTVFDIGARYALKPITTEQMRAFVAASLPAPKRGGGEEAFIARAVDELAGALGLTPAEREIVFRRACGESRERVRGARASETLKKHRANILRKARVKRFADVMESVLRRVIALRGARESDPTE